MVLSDSSRVITYKGKHPAYKDYSYTSCTGYSSVEEKILEEGQILFVEDIKKCKNYLGKEKTIVSSYYGNHKISFEVDNDNLFMFFDKEEKTTYTLDDFYQAYSSMSEENRNRFQEYAQYTGREIQKNIEIEKLEKEIDSYKKYGIGIINAHATENYSMTGAKFKIINLSKKTIKYITFNFYGKNAVEDKVLYRNGVYNTTRKGIGPIESYETAAWEFDTVWLTSTVEYLTLNSITIQYMDNTIKTLKMSENLWFDDSIISRYNFLSE